jgi:hypothetical protein
MQSIPLMLQTLWGNSQAPRVAAEYRDACTLRPLFLRDLAMFCNAAAPVMGASEFDRGVEEGKRRVWLHVARMAGLKASDFVSIADGKDLHD